MLLSVFWALGKFIVLDLTGRPFNVQTYNNLWIDPVVPVVTLVCMTALWGKRSVAFLFARAADLFFQDPVRGQAGLAYTDSAGILKPTALCGMFLDDRIYSDLVL